MGVLVKEMLRSEIIKTLAVPGFALMAFASANCASAQATATGGSDIATLLPQVTVQARRISENQQKVPVAVTALAGKALQQDTITQISDLQKNVPSLEIDPGSLGGSGDPRFTVRGLSGTLVSDPSVVTYFDQVPLDPKDFAYQQYDLESVQVLKGPQGTLFGRNSTGGAVLFAPVRPGSKFGGYVDLRYGNFNDRDLSAAINLPLDETLSVRLAGETEERDGIVKSVTGGGQYDNRKHGSFRAELLYRPNDRYENYLQGTVYRVRESNAQPQLTAVAPCTVGLGGVAPICYFSSATGIIPGVPGFIPTNVVTGAPDVGAEFSQQQTLGRDRTVSNFHAPFDVDYDGLTDIATARFGSVTIKNIAHADIAKYHLGYDLTGTGAGLLDQQDSQSNRNYSDELQFYGVAFDSRLSWLLGGFYDKFTQSEDEVFNLVGYPGNPAFFFPGNPTSPQTVTLNEPQESEALFGQATLDLGQWISGVSITGGYRYTWDHRSLTQTRLQPGGFISAGPPPVILPPCALIGFPGVDPATCVENLSTRFSNSNYNISLNWQASPNTMAYIATRRGYKSGGFNFAATDPAFIEYKPETVTDVEIGLKSDWRLAEMPVRTNVAVYEARYEDIQAQFVTVSPSGLPEALIVNYDPVTGSHNKATLTGGEAEVTLVPLPELRITGFYGYASGKYDTFVNSTSGTPISLAGQQIDGIANSTGGVSINVTPDLPDDLGHPEITANYYGRSKLSSNSLNPGAIGGYANLDLRVDWRGAFHTPVDVAIYGNNVTNDRHVTIDNNLLNVVGVEAKQYAEPTTYGVELRYRFGG